MATATTNKLPEFATKPQDNTFDTEIINKSSELEDTGFVPNTTIRSSQMNTYMKMMIESLRGIVDGLYRQTAVQHEIKANSTAQDWQNYIQKGLDDLIEKTTVNVSKFATEAMSMVTNEGNLLGVGGLQKPIYFADGKPVSVNMFAEVGKYFLTKQSYGKYTAKLNDGTHFLALVEVEDENANICLSGIAEFDSAAITGMLSGSFIRNQTGSGSSTAFINTKVYSTKNPSVIHVEGQAVSFDGTISDNVNYAYIRITKLYQID